MLILTPVHLGRPSTSERHRARRGTAMRARSSSTTGPIRNATDSGRARTARPWWSSTPTTGREARACRSRSPPARCRRPIRLSIGPWEESLSLAAGQKQDVVLPPAESGAWPLRIRSGRRLPSVGARPRQSRRAIALGVDCDPLTRLGLTASARQGMLSSLIFDDRRTGALRS